MWHAIQSPAEASTFEELVGRFHDGCIHELHVITEHFVNESLRMGVGLEWDTSARIVVQRQFRPYSAIEMFFGEVRRINIAPSPPDFESIINSATLLQRDGVWYWADTTSWTPERQDRDEATWIAAGQLWWRDASDWLGKVPRYVSAVPGPRWK